MKYWTDKEMSLHYAQVENISLGGKIQNPLNPEMSLR
jgi:hypothetical protein